MGKRAPKKDGCKNGTLRESFRVLLVHDIAEAGETNQSHGPVEVETDERMVSV